MWRWSAAPGRPAGAYRHGENTVTWGSADTLPEFWSSIREHYEVPGGLDAVANDEGETFSGHVWRSGIDRLLVIEVNRVGVA